MNPLMQPKTTTLKVFISLVFFCFALCPLAQAVVPPPDGGYPNFNTAEGQKALFSLTTGVGNTAVGSFSLLSNTDGSFNTATGTGTLLFNTGDENTALGAAALLFNTTGFNNTAVGTAALLNNTEGDANTATGHSALHGNTTGNFNTANGVNALRDNTVGNFNNAYGHGALGDNVDGNQNNAFGDSALANVVSGDFNTAIGDEALVSNVSGDSNTAVGDQTLAANTGSGNTAVGADALASNTTGGNNTAIGINALFNSTTGNLNTALGLGAGIGVTTASNVICIGADGANVSNSCFIGNVGGVGIGNDAMPVLIDSNDQLGTVSSSRRFKKEIKPMDKASEAVLALKPVTFHYKSDKTSTPQFGLIAEEVAEVNPDLVVRDKNGEIYTVRYDQVNAMLLNEFLKEHRKNEEQEVTITHQQKQIEALTAILEEQAAQIQKISAQIDVSRAAPRVANNNQ
jgi:trimeric autotransporter adhesin